MPLRLQPLQIHATGPFAARLANPATLARQRRQVKSRAFNETQNVPGISHRHYAARLELPWGFAAGTVGVVSVYLARQYAKIPLLQSWRAIRIFKSTIAMEAIWHIVAVASYHPPKLTPGISL